MRLDPGPRIGGPILDLMGWIYQRIRVFVYADVEGRYFKYKGNPIDIVEGSNSDMWLSLSDVRRTIPGLPRYRTLQRLCPSSVSTEGASKTERIESRGLADLLMTSREAKTIRFLRWLQRDVIFPAEKREQMGRRK